MADLKYKVAVDTAGAKSSLNGLKTAIGLVGTALASAFAVKEVVKISSKFQDLRTTLGILYKDTKTGAQAFEQIKTFATKSIFTVEDLTASIIKLKAAGLDPTIKQMELFADVSSVSADSVGALRAMTDLYARSSVGGLGLEELNRLGDRGIPVFTILKDKLKLNRLEISKFGQNAEGAAIILKALEEGLSETFSGASAARAQNVSQAFSNLEDAMANASDTIGQAGLNEAIANAIKGISNFIDANQGLAMSIGKGLGGAIKYLSSVVTYLGKHIEYIGGLFAGLAGYAAAALFIKIAASVMRMAAAFRAAAIAGTLLQGVTGIGVIKLGVGLAAAGLAVVKIKEMSGDAAEEIKKLNDEADRLAKEAAGSGPGPLTGAGDAPGDAPTLDAMLGKFKAKQTAITQSSIDYFKTYRTGVDDLMRAVKEEQHLLTLAESQANVQKDLNRFQQRYYDAVRPLQQQVIELKLKETEQAKVQAEEIQKQIDLITQYYNKSTAGLEEELHLRELNRIAQEQQEAMIGVKDDTRDFNEGMAKRVRDAQRSIEQLNMNAFERQLDDINKSVDTDLIEAMRSVREKWEDGLITSDAMKAEMDILMKSAESTGERLKELATQQRDTQRSFAYGWRKAFESFEDDATNAAKQAEKVFTKMSQGIEDSIVSFVKTGKFEMKSLINDILEQMLRSQIKQVIAQTFGALGAGGGRGGSGGGLGSLFSGFFANGGMIPAGSFGVVGERGPEMVSGPATVTPLGGGAVTYNINAVDASSFKQMVARDPGFIHAVASQGAKKVPLRR